MEPFERENIRLPSSDPTTYCRLCLSKAGLRKVTSASEPVNLVQLIRKQLDIQLTEPDDFPCAVCTVCDQKLEELSHSNHDGLLNEWGDDGLLEYRNECKKVNTAIKNWRSAENTVAVGDKTLVLPFQQLADGRYQCKQCPNLIFNDISTCIKHHQLSHLNTIAENDIGQGIQGASPDKRSSECGDVNTYSVTNGTSTKDADRLNDGIGVRNNSAKGRKKTSFKCVSCDESFDQIDLLIEHRSILHSIAKPQKRKKVLGKPKQFMIDNNFTTCKECNVEFPDKKTFYVHLNAIHDVNICNVCDVSFSALYLLTRHQAYHRNLNDIINPFLLGKHSFHCKVCFEKFRTEREIRLHYQLKHTDSNNGYEGIETSSSSERSN